MIELKQKWELPKNPKPIVIIGAGNIINDAHMPAYKKAGFKVEGLFDVNIDNAKKIADDWGIPTVFTSIEQATKNSNCIYDLGLPPSVINQVLNKLPDNSAVLIQKPMGENFNQALEILATCRRKKLKSAINFQLRYSPQMLAIADAVTKGILGDILEVEVHLNVHTPWDIFPFLKKMQRVEIAVHSIHYIDLIKSIIGSPNSVFARTMIDPRAKDFAQTRTSTIFAYDNNLRCTMSINHNHQFGAKFQDCNIRFEGTKGAMMAKLGVNLNYPHGEPDELWLATKDNEWQSIKLEGEWFPDAFIGPMSNLQRYVSGEDKELYTSTEDCIATMSIVEACFEANKIEGIRPPSW